MVAAKVLARDMHHVERPFSLHIVCGETWMRAVRQMASEVFRTIFNRERFTNENGAL